MNPYNYLLSNLHKYDANLIESVSIAYNNLFENVNVDPEVINALTDIKTALENNGNVFFHSSDANNPVGSYIDPQCGPWVREVISGATDDDGFAEELAEKSQYVFLSKDPSWIKAKAERGGGLDVAHLAIVILDEGDMSNSIYHVDETGEKLTDLSGQSAGYIEGVGPERGDWFSDEAVPVAYEFTGDKLKQFLKLYSEGKYNVFMESVESLMEYQTDLFRSDDEAKAADEKLNREYDFKDAIQDFIDSDININDVSDVESYLYDHRNIDVMQLIKIIFEKLSIEYNVIPLIDNTTLIITSSYYLVINDSTKTVLIAKPIKSLPDDLSESPEDFIPKKLEFLSDYSDYINKKFWENPETLYHATPDENVNDIIDSGLVPSSETRGISNRGVGSAVFTSTESGEIDSYGDNVFEINTDLMKQDGYMPVVGKEPDVEKYELVSALGSFYNIDDISIDIEQGQSPNTYIVYGKIPSKYVGLMN